MLTDVWLLLKSTCKMDKEQRDRKKIGILENADEDSHLWDSHLTHIVILTVHPKSQYIVHGQLVCDSHVSCCSYFMPIINIEI